MFKKIILLLIVLSPLWYSLLIGYPVVSAKNYQMRIKTTPYTISRRCFGVGDFNQFVYCSSHAERSLGRNFITTIIDKSNQIFPLFTLVLSTSLFMFILLSILIIFWK